MLHLDNRITNFVLDNTTVFENIHPNYITLFGVGLNLLIFNELFKKEDNKKDWNKLAILFGFRWFADCLDGNVARRYNKQSQLGNTLDTLSDLMIQSIFVYYVYTKLQNENFKKILAISFILFIIMLVCKFNIFKHHDDMKNGGDFISEIMTVIIRNTIIVFIAIYYVLQNIPMIENKLLDLIK
jgi:phosphatidylserine synthase